MARFIIHRLMLLPLLMVIFSVMVFAIVQAPPGDFLTSYAATLASSGSSVNLEQLEALREQYGLDQPIAVQYFRWVANLLQGDLGLSLEYQRPNIDLIREQLGLTLALAAFSFVLTWAIAIPAGIYSATHQRSWLDYVLTVFNYVGVATPNFLLALVLMWLAFSYFDIGITGLFSSEMAGQPWSFAKFVDLLQAHLAALAGAGDCRHRAPDTRDARQSARRAQ